MKMLNVNVKYLLITRALPENTAHAHGADLQSVMLTQRPRWDSVVLLRAVPHHFLDHFVLPSSQIVTKHMQQGLTQTLCEVEYCLCS